MFCPMNIRRRELDGRYFRDGTDFPAGVGEESDPEVLEDDGDGVPVAAGRRGGRGMEILQLRAAETH